MKAKSQGSQYDKIFKENIEAVIQSIMRNVPHGRPVGITAISLEELPDDVQHTKERKPDVLKKVVDTHNNIFVLQIEFQVKNDDEMAHRMLDYKAMLFRKYRLPIHQYVIYLGRSVVSMESNLQTLGLTFEYNLLSINTIDYKTFLKSNQPEEIVLAILANFDKEKPESVLKQIVSKLEETTNSDLALKRYFKQLRILAQLRKLEKKLKNTIMDNIAKYIDEEKDVAYLIGFDKGEEKIVSNLLKKLNYNIEQIADIAGVSVEFVSKVKQQLLSAK